MAQSKRRRRWDWLEAPVTTRQESPAVVSRLYRLSYLANRGLISEQTVLKFRKVTGLANFTWRIYYHQRPTGQLQPLSHLVSRAHGYVILLHGWDSSHAIWEDLPIQVCEANPRLVCFAPDVNGFGGSPFYEAEYPRLNLCGPRGDMQAIEAWLDLLKLHRSDSQRQIFTFVGHSMSGAALFHKARQGWEQNRYSLLALAPAMLHHDTIKQALYRTLGISIGAGQQIDFLNHFKDRLALPIMEMLATNASWAVKKEHERIFKRTAKGTLAQTFFALGLADETPPPRDWNNVLVMLGHKDRLVALNPTLNLLENMGLSSQNIQVVLGDHYFSVSQQSRRLHTLNREALLHHILDLHEAQG